jgi:hypothetical protein
LLSVPGVFRAPLNSTLLYESDRTILTVIKPISENLPAKGLLNTRSKVHYKQSANDYARQPEKILICSTLVVWVR